MTERELSHDAPLPPDMLTKKPNNTLTTPLHQYEQNHTTEPTSQYTQGEPSQLHHIGAQYIHN